MEIDLESLRLNGSPLTSRPPPKAHVQEQRFVKGPIPLSWLQQAIALPGKALHVGCIVWYLSGLNRSHPVIFSPAVAAQFGLSRGAARRGLLCLEKAELVSVQRQSPKSPRVTLLGQPKRLRAV